MKYFLYLGLGLFLSQAAWAATPSVKEAAQPTAVFQPAKPQAGQTLTFEQYMQLAENNRRRGFLVNAEHALFAAGGVAANLQEQVIAAGELGAVYLQARRFPNAEKYLSFAVKNASESNKHRYFLDLGNSALLDPDKRDPELATKYYQQALESKDPQVRSSAGINLARVADSNKKLSMLEKALKDIALVTNESARTRLQLAVSNMAAKLGNEGLPMSYFYARRALLAGEKIADRRVQMLAYDILSRLYFNQGSYDDSMRLVNLGVQNADIQNDQDILLQLEWRRGQIYDQRKDTKSAIAAYQRAVDLIQEIRIDIPIDYEDGRSSFRDTLEPIYLALSDSLMRYMDAESTLSEKEQTQLLYRARDVAELIKQTELQDYLGDRCTVETAQAAAQTDSKQSLENLKIEPGTAIFYPIIFPDRVELLVQTASGIQRATSKVTAPAVRRIVYALASDLRSGGMDVQKDAARLYDVLFRPIQKILEDNKIKHIVSIPDGVLRLIPLTALYDGKQYAIEKYSISISPGLSMTQVKPADGKQKNNVLIAGLSIPGDGVVEKLAGASTAGIFNAARVDRLEQGDAPAVDNAPKSRGLASTVKTRNLAACADSLSELVALNEGAKAQANFSDLVTRGVDVAQANPASLESAQAREKTRASRLASLKEDLKLPGVQLEVDSLSQVTKGFVLLNGAFTLSNFTQKVESGDYNIVHIASHGVFGGNANNSFVLADDNLITMDRLQTLLRSGKLDRNPLDLLTLSACETADGDDRAPLGISGAALKSRARSTIGTLWPVADDAAKNIMADFYSSLFNGVNKSDALRKAQLALVNDPKMNNPFYWAPFILVGSWM